MDRILVIVVSVLAGLAGGYFIFNFLLPKNPIETAAKPVIVISAPSLINELSPIEFTTYNHLILKKKVAVTQVSAVFIRQWMYKIRLTVDLDKIDWTKISNINTELEQADHILLSGELPPLQIQGNVIDGSITEEVIAEALGFGEEKFYPVATKLTDNINKCAREQYGLTQLALDHAKAKVAEHLIGQLTINAKKEPTISTKLVFENEDELLKIIAGAQNQAIRQCGGSYDFDEHDQ